MNMHQNARLTPLGRERLVRLIESGLPVSRAAQAVGVTAKTGAKWYRRFNAEGPGAVRGGITDKSGLAPESCGDGSVRPEAVGA